MKFTQWLKNMQEQEDYRKSGYDFRNYGVEGPPAKPYPLEEGIVYMAWDGKLYKSKVSAHSLQWEPA